MKKIKQWISEHMIIVLLASVVGLGLFYGYSKNMATEYVTIKVTDKERVITGSGDSMSSKYLVYTNNGTYEVTDTFWHFRWDSSDFYGKLEKGKTYRALVCGWRVPFMSMYQNVLEVQVQNLN